MKVLLTHELFPPEDHGGGGELVVSKMAKCLLEKGVDVKVLTTGNPKIKKFDSIETVRIPVNRYFMNLTYFQMLKFVKDCDIVQTNNYNACLPSWMAAKTLKKPIVCLIHGMYGNKWIDMRGSLFGTISKSVEALQVKHDFNKIIFLSEYARQAGLDIGIKKEITEVIWPGTPQEFNKYHVRKKEPFVLFAGRLAKQKGVRYLIEAARKLPEIKFVFVGKEEDEAGLKSSAPENIEFRGFVPVQELLDLYSRAMIFCLPSIGETFGLVLLEAMASGCAIVSTVPLDYEGIRIKPKDPTEIANAIKKLFSNQKTAISMGKKNRELSKKYSWESFTKRILEIYDELL